MRKQTIPDALIIPLIKSGCNDYQILRFFGLPNGYLRGPLKRLREQLGIPSPGKDGRRPVHNDRIPSEEGVTTYYMSQEEIRKRYGPPRLLAKDKTSGEAQADNYLKEKAVDIKEEARRKRRGHK